jgi:hypothetical protein
MFDSPSSFVSGDCWLGPDLPPRPFMAADRGVSRLGLTSCPPAGKNRCMRIFRFTQNALWAMILRKVNMSQRMMEVSREKGPVPEPPRSGECRAGTPAQGAARPGGLCETKPISGGVSSWKCQVSSGQGSGRGFTLHTSHLTLGRRPIVRNKANSAPAEMSVTAVMKRSWRETLAT